MAYGEDFDSDSELTSLEKLDEEARARAKNTSTVSPPIHPFEFPVLKAIKEAILSKRIKLDPDYQRDVVWDEMQQCCLIDSVMNNFGINQILFSTDKENRDGHNVDVKTCIDGKQRLTAIFLFMEGKIGSLDPKTMEMVWYKVDENDPSARTRKVLDEQSKITWNEKQIWCSEYESLTDAQQRELFQRVQMGMPLTLPETLQAIGSPRARFVRALKKRVFHSNGFHSTCPTKWIVSRGLDFQHMACVVYMISMYHDKEPAKHFEPAPKRLEPWLKEEKLTIPKTLADAITDVIDILLLLATSADSNKIFPKGKKPFGSREFSSIACFIYQFMDRMTLDQLARGVGKVRREVGSKRAIWKYLRDTSSWKKEVGELDSGMSAREAIKQKSDSDSVVAPGLAAAIATNAAKDSTLTAPPAARTTASRVKRKLDTPSDKGEVAASVPKPTDVESPKKRSRAAPVERRPMKVKASAPETSTTTGMADAPPIAPAKRRLPKRKWDRIDTDDEDALMEDEGDAPPPKHPRTGGEDASDSPQAGPDTMTLVTELRPSVQKDQVAGLSNMTTVLKRQAGRGSGTKSSAATKPKAKTKAPTKPQLPPPIPRTGPPASFKQLKIPKFSDPPKPAASPQLPVSYPSPVSRTTTPTVNSPKPPPQPPLPQTTFALNSAPNANARQSPFIDARVQQVLPRDSCSPITTESGRFDRVRRNRDQASANVASATSILPLAPVPNAYPPRIPESATSASAPRPQATTDPRRRPLPPIQIPPSIGKLESSSSSSSAVVPLDLSELLQPMQEKHYFSSPSVSPLPRVRQSPTIPQYGDNFSNALPTPYRTSSANTMRGEVPNLLPTSQQHTTPNTSQLPPRLKPQDFPVGVGVPVASTVIPHQLREQHQSPARSISNSETNVFNHNASPFYQLVEPGNMQPLTGDQLKVAREMKRKTSWERSQGGVH
ncbi:hypothetical protein EYR38_010039 [Pleurotus pulmonarius]|nr:hypothetical protein EYR38_010039 [Pleurotus pulmonarius]